jgi:hypothetical protein
MQAKINKEESDPDFDFDDVDVETPAAVEEPTAAKETQSAETLDPNGITPEAVALRASGLAKEVGLTATPAVPGASQNETRQQIFVNPFAGLVSGVKKLIFEVNNRRKAVSASDEAKAAKDKVVSLGSDIIRDADRQALAQMIAEGLIPADVTDLDTYIADIVEADRALPSTNQIGITASSDVKGLRKNLVDSLSDEEYAALLAEAKELYGIINIESGTSEGLEISAGTRDDNLLVLADWAGYTPWEVREKPDTPMILDRAREGLKKLHADVLKAEGIEDGVTPLGMVTSYAATGKIKDTLKLDDVLGAMLIMRNHKDALDRFKAINENLRTYRVEREALGEQRKNALKRRQEIIREKTIALLKAAGFKFDSVKLEDFNGRIVQTRGGRAIAEDNEAGEFLLKSWEFLPESILRKASEMLKARGFNLQVQHVRGRAGYSNGKLHARDTGSYLHEQGHWIEDMIPAIPYLEHAFLEDRALQKNGKLSRLADANDSTTEDLGEEVSLSDVGLTQQYSGRLYRWRRGGGDWFNPKNGFFEVFTTGLEDLFTDLGAYSQGGTQKVMIGSGVNSEIVYTAYKDPQTGVWYRDSSKAERITPTKVMGRSSRDGLDVEFKGFTLGVLLMLNDWSS